MSALTAERLAAALEHFWNPASESIRRASYHGPASGSDVISAIAEGFAAVAAALRVDATTTLSADQQAKIAQAHKNYMDGNIDATARDWLIQQATTQQVAA